jgi:hypothetical protein
VPKRRKNSNIGSLGSIAAAVFCEPVTLILTTAGPVLSTMALKSGSAAASRAGGAAAGAIRGGNCLGGADGLAAKFCVAHARAAMTVTASRLRLMVVACITISWLVR